MLEKLCKSTKGYRIGLFIVWSLAVFYLMQNNVGFIESTVIMLIVSFIYSLHHVIFSIKEYKEENAKDTEGKE